MVKFTPSEIFLPLSKIYLPIREFRNKQNLQERQIMVEIHGTPPQNGLLLLTHPTKEDTRITRYALPNSFPMVTSSELKFTNFDKINQIKVPKSFLERNSKVNEQDIRDFFTQVTNSWTTATKKITNQL